MRTSRALVASLTAAARARVGLWVTARRGSHQPRCLMPAVRVLPDRVRCYRIDRLTGYGYTLSCGLRTRVRKTDATLPERGCDLLPDSPSGFVPAPWCDKGCATLDKGCARGCGVFLYRTDWSGAGGLGSRTLGAGRYVAETGQRIARMNRHLVWFKRDLRGAAYAPLPTAYLRGESKTRDARRSAKGVPQTRQPAAGAALGSSILAGAFYFWGMLRSGT